MRYVFIVNPVAGKGKALETVKPMAEKFFQGSGLEYKIAVSEKKGDTKRIAAEEAQAGDDVTFFACGGEGTSFDIINGVADYENVTLGVIPCGSANDFLKYFGDKDAFFDLSEQINGEEIKVDLIKADEFYCINGCSAGMDAIVADDMSIFKKWPLVSGPMAYKLAVIKTFFRKIGTDLKITVDGKCIGIRDSLFAVVSNGPVYGGGFRAAPDAIPFDGKLDFTLVDTISKLKAPKFLSYYKNGTQSQLDYCKLGRCETFEISAEKEIPINLDGEIIHRKRMSFGIVKEKLRFLVPRAVANKMLINYKKIRQGT